MKDTEGASLQKDELQCSCAGVPHPESACGGASYTHLLSLPTQHGNTSKGSLLHSSPSSVPGNSWEPAKPALLTVSWQLWMECAYVEGKRERRGNDVVLFENTCINMFTSGSFLQVACTVQQQTALYFFFPIAALVFYETTNLQIFTQVPRI